jgi:hypothetical protein
VQEGHPAPRQGPKAGDRLPDARIAKDGQRCWLGDALAERRFHLLLCGDPGGWDAGHLAAMCGRYPDTLAVHHLVREATLGGLHDVDGQALAQLGVNDTAHYLIRPDGHIGYRATGTDLDGLGRYLARWLPNSTPDPA